MTEFLQGLIVVLFDGLAFGMLLFVLSVGLTLTLGLMNFVNLAHGAFAMMGAYVAVVVSRDLGLSFWFALLASFIGIGIVGAALEVLVFRRLYKRSELTQVLFTVGFVFVSTAIASYLFGPAQQWTVLPPYLKGVFTIGGISFGIYRIFLILLSLMVTGLLVLGIEHTRFGAQVRAAVDNRAVADGIGINVGLVFAVTFGIGAALAGLGGALAVEMTGLDPNFGFHYLVYVLIVVTVGGLGRIPGSFVAASLLGILDVAGKYYFPQAGSFLIYALMVVLLFFRPRGLMGIR